MIAGALRTARLLGLWVGGLGSEGFFVFGFGLWSGVDRQTELLGGSFRPARQCQKTCRSSGSSTNSRGLSQRTATLNRNPYTQRSGFRV